MDAISLGQCDVLRDFYMDFAKAGGDPTMIFFVVDLFDIHWIFIWYLHIL